MHLLSIFSARKLHTVYHRYCFLLHTTGDENFKKTKRENNGAGTNRKEVRKTGQPRSKRLGVEFLLHSSVVLAVSPPPAQFLVCDVGTTTPHSEDRYKYSIR